MLSCCIRPATELERLVPVELVVLVNPHSVLKGLPCCVFVNEVEASGLALLSGHRLAGGTFLRNHAALVFHAVIALWLPNVAWVVIPQSELEHFAQ